MARVYASDGGFRHPQLTGESGGLFGSRARPGMGLFGSQARPGMRAGTTNLGSLGGSTLGDAPIDDNTINAPVATAPAPAVPVPAPMTTKTKLMLAGGAVAVWWVFFRKKG